ncbi:MAG TPA: bifunctional 4-hydroxy-2-oxoglutarate aldolase/2-dehydro-3-deoxy-phosphogluconate aldolase [Candidatus Baltobacteraceae bacterium]|jgi:2-dehydro-3-deoxyphosphogluconate aldolase/(4S)-4-hydroxy-2-oxoglutarate aldolase|nr:bifunctional 4-hydroxy-2-oxoglutarate aldolase/2-dehydro-3-deoxy-phosphogluconate aldolase [Candidatus Baltobacteraceae bacterium]
MIRAQAALSRIEDCGIIAVLRGGFTEATAIQTCETLFDEGISVFEFTMNSRNPLALLAAVKQAFGERAIVGMGTVLDTDTARRVIDGDADFLLSPGCDPEVVKVVHDAGLLMCPGVFTPTECIGADKLGAKLLKLFPVGPLGVGIFRTIKGPLGHLKFLCDGGMTIENIPQFLAAGAAACGIVEALTGDGTDSQSAIRDRARRLMDSIREARPMVAIRG